MVAGHLCRLAAGAALFAALGACGYKGPLTLPPPPDAKLAAPPTPVTLPEPAAPEAGQAASPSATQ